MDKHQLEIWGSKKDCEGFLSALKEYCSAAGVTIYDVSQIISEFIESIDNKTNENEN